MRLDSIPPREVQVVTNVNQARSLRTPTLALVMIVHLATNVLRLLKLHVIPVSMPQLRVRNVSNVRMDLILTPRALVSARSANPAANAKVA